MSPDPVFRNRIGLICLLYAGGALVASLLAQYVWGFQPCRLCIWQRVSTITILFSAAWILFLPNPRSGLWVLRICLMASCVLAAWHLAIQLGWLSDPCAVPKAIVSTTEAFRAMLQAPRPCSAAPWKLLGLPISGFSALGAGVLFAMTWIGQRRRVREAAPFAIPPQQNV